MSAFLLHKAIIKCDYQQYERGGLVMHRDIACYKGLRPQSDSFSVLEPKMK